MHHCIQQSESGDWFLVPWEKRHDFFEDELEEKADYAEYISFPDSIKIIKYEYRDGRV